MTLQQKLKKWVKILRLQDYDITLVEVDEDHVGDGYVGLINSQHEYNRATIRIATKHSDPESTLVHELIHLRTEELCRIIDMLSDLVGSETGVLAEKLTHEARERIAMILEKTLIDLDRKNSNE